RDLGRKDRPLRHRARGDADLGLRRRARRAGGRALLLCVGGAHPAHRRLGHALSALGGVGLFSRPRPRRARPRQGDGGLVMGVRSIRMPDVGEGVAEAEIVEWHVKVGDLVREDQVVAAVMTDKATVEIPTHVAGTVVALGGAVGDVLAVGAELIRIDAPGLPDSIAPAAPKSTPKKPEPDPAQVVSRETAEPKPAPEARARAEAS